jgi:hypothetical protein
MSTKDYEFKYFVAGVDSLEEYLFSQELYWQLGIEPPSGTPPFPTLTLGNLLLSRKKSLSFLLQGDARDQFDSSDHKFEYIHAKWRSAWEKKAEQEIRSRLKLWQAFLDDYLSDPSANTDRYPYEVRRRVIISLLANDIGVMASSEREILDGLDKTLLALFIPDGFVWEMDLVEAFPKDDFPYLYGKLRD